MSVQAFGRGAAQAAGANLVTAALSTPQGQAAVVGTVALAVAAAPIVAGAAIGGSIGYGLIKFVEWLES